MVKRMFAVFVSFFIFFSIIKAALSDNPTGTETKPAATGNVIVPQFESNTDNSIIFPLEQNEGSKEKSADETKPAANSKDDLYNQVELFSYALTTVQSEYAEEPKAKDLIYGALKGMLSSLDPHSQFLDPDDYKDLKTETEGKFGGLGIEISIRDGLLTVITPLEDTPAWKAGIKAGDHIVKIGDQITKDLTLPEAVKKLRGKPGTEVKITVLREEDFKIYNFAITREIIHVQDVKDPRILEDHIGYVRLTEFREDSYKELHKVLLDLKNQGADSLIFDLRNNPGGLLNIAIKITEEFLPSGKLIVSTKSRHPSQNTETYSKNISKDLISIPMVVLINEGSASGSEILAGALKDNKRAVILGMKSFGKGSVQSVIPLPDGSGLRLTTSKYFTPSGVSIHGIGITPDIEIKRVSLNKTKAPKENDEPDEEQQPIREADLQKAREGAKELKDLDAIFKNVETKTEITPEALEKTRKEKEITNKLLSDNQIQSAIVVIKGIKAYKNFVN